MGIKEKIKDSAKEARECLKRLAAGGIIGVENCQYVAILWGKLLQIEGLTEKLADEEGKKDNPERME